MMTIWWWVRFDPVDEASLALGPALRCREYIHYTHGSIEHSPCGPVLLLYVVCVSTSMNALFLWASIEFIYRHIQCDSNAKNSTRKQSRSVSSLTNAFRWVYNNNNNNTKNTWIQYAMHDIVHIYVIFIIWNIMYKYLYSVVCCLILSIYAQWYG